MVAAVKCFILVSVAMAAALPSNERPSEQLELVGEEPREIFTDGFSPDFAHNLPTLEFMGDFSRRTKRQVGITSALEGILRSPYTGASATNHLQALISRNNKQRPARQSTNSQGDTTFASPPRPNQPSFSPPRPSQSSFSPPRSNQPSFSPPRPNQSSFSPPRPNQSSFSPPRPNQSSFSPPRPNQPSFSPPRPKQSSFSPPRPSQTSFSPPRPNQPSFSPPRPSTSSSPHRPNPSFSSRNPDSNSSQRPSSQSQSFRTQSSNFRGPSSQPQSSSSNFKVIGQPQPPRLSPSSQPSFSPAPSRREQLSHSQEPFPSSSFTGQQIGSFSDIDSFFESARMPRQRRDVTARQDDAAQLHQIFNSPYEGSVPLSLDTLLNHNNRSPRNPKTPKPIQSRTVDTPRGRAHVLGPISSHPFAIPFIIPNVFEPLGIRRRRDLSAFQRRQGVSDAIDLIIGTPYTGGFPDSFDSFFRPSNNRFVRKTQSSSRLRPFTQISVIGSNDPSEASVRLFPVSTSFQVSDKVSPSHKPTRVVFKRKKRSLRGQLPFNEQDLQESASTYNRRFMTFRPRARDFPRPVNQRESRSQYLKKPPQFRGPEFGELTVEYEYGGQDPTLRDTHLENSNGKRPGALPSSSKKNPSNSLTEQNDSFHHKRKPEPKPLTNVPRPARYPSNRPTHTFRPRYRPSKNLRQPRPFIPGLVPGPSPPAHILPPTSTIRAPRHILRENRRLPKATRQQDIPINRRRYRVLQRRMSLERDDLDSDAAREESSGFMSSRPIFPNFAAISGFEPLGDVEKGTVEGTFMQDIDFPKVSIHDIEVDQPKFEPPQFPQQQTQSSSEPVSQSIAANHQEAVISRTRRQAAEPDLSDPANVPHKRVHRVQAELQVPHNRGPREFLSVPDSQTSHSENPLHFRSATGFQFPNFHTRVRELHARGGSSRFQSATRIPARFNPELTVEAEKLKEEIISPDSQRFYPTFNGRHPPLPPSRQPFFPSPPVPPRSPGPRGSRFIPHSQAFRESPSHREQSPFRDFHNSYHGSGVRETFQKPDFSFPSSQRPSRPFHREHEYENHDNSLLGSGNFEVLSGGTFYDNGDPGGLRHEYDHLLEDDYGTFPGVHSRPHTNNYVDDFFSNFRDFSEFAARKSDEGEATTYLDDDEEHYGRGYASEHVQQFAAESAPITISTAKTNTTHQKTNNSQNLDDKKKDVKPTSTTTHIHKHKQPKNIQDVLEEIDPRPSESSPSIAADEKDPMIAMF